MHLIMCLILLTPTILKLVLHQGFREQWKVKQTLHSNLQFISKKKKISKNDEIVQTNVKSDKIKNISNPPNHAHLPETNWS